MGDDVPSGMAHGDGHVLWSTNHHAFDNGLAAVIHVCWWNRRVRCRHWAALLDLRPPGRYRYEVLSLSPVSPNEAKPAGNKTHKRRPVGRLLWCVGRIDG